MCTSVLSKDDTNTFQEAIKEHYWYQMYVDELPVWGMVGEYVNTQSNAPPKTPLMFTHKIFSISYNGHTHTHTHTLSLSHTRYV